ncbi:MAG: pilus assembly protein HicB [bacterium]
MSKSAYPLKLPSSVKNAAAELAKADGVSLNQFIASAVAEKVGSLRAAEVFLAERAGGARPKDLLRHLRRAPKVPPSPGDELPTPRRTRGRRA